MRVVQFGILFLALAGSPPVQAGARTMGVIFVDVGTEKADELRDKLVNDLVAQGCWARDECPEGVGLRTDLPKGLTKADLQATAAGDEGIRPKVAKIANSEAGPVRKHPGGYFWHFDGFLVYAIDRSKREFTITTLDEEAGVIGSVKGDAAAVLKRKWGRRTLLEQALKPLRVRFRR